jgi:hypothetical protein
MEPCGRSCCSVPFNFAHCTDQPKPVDVEGLEPDVAAALTRRAEDADRATAHHEAGHVLCALAYGRGVANAQVAGQAHVTYAQGAAVRVTEEIAVCCSLAGDIAAGFARHRIVPPSTAEIACYLDKARRGEAGGCDSCTIAKVLFVRDLDATDDELAERWLNYWRRCVELFDTVSFRAALGRLATALRKRRRMSGSDIEAIVSAETLQAAREACSSN